MDAFDAEQKLHAGEPEDATSSDCAPLAGGHVAKNA